MSVVKVKLWKDKAFLNGEFQDLRSISIKMPGYKKFVGDSLLFELSGKNIECLLKEPSVEWSQDSKKIAEAHKIRLIDEENSIATKRKWSGEKFEDFEFKSKPFDHQLKALMLSKDKEYYGYFMEMGTGKTKVIIDNAAYLYGKKLINSLIILAPNGVHAQWIKEQLPEHLPEWVKHEAAIYRATEHSCLKSLAKLAKEKTDALKIIAFNIDALSSEKGGRVITSFLSNHNAMFVIDESVRIKTPSAIRTKWAIKLGELAKYRRIMSGAPVTKGTEDLFTQFKFLHEDILGYSSYYTFRNNACIMGGFENRQIVGYKPYAMQEIERKIEAHTFRITKKECLDLPDKIYSTRYVELTDEQAKIYDKLEEDLQIDLDSIRQMKELQENGETKKVDSALMSAITKMLRMQQVVCGHFAHKEEDSDLLIELPTNRIEVLIDCIEEAQGKVIVWSRFVADIKRISKRLQEKKIYYRTYYGEVNTKEREVSIKEFRENPECKVFLAQPASGGTGLNLAVANTVIYFSNDFNADTRWQSEDRAHRIGQKSNVNYIDLISLNTIDEDILKALKNKKNVAEALLDLPRKIK